MNVHPRNDQIVIRRARHEDAEPVWRCRLSLRDSAAFQSSSDVEKFETHVSWFMRIIKNPAYLFYIIESDGLWSGYLRFDPLDTIAGRIVSIALLASASGRGIGGIALMKGCIRAELKGFTPLFADIHVTNQASRRIFEKCCFAPLAPGKPLNGFQRLVRYPISSTHSIDRSKS